MGTFDLELKRELSPAAWPEKLHEKPLQSKLDLQNQDAAISSGSRCDLRCHLKCCAGAVNPCSARKARRFSCRLG